MSCIFCGSSVQFVAAIIFSLNQIPNYFYSSPTSGMWDKETWYGRTLVITEVIL